MSGNKKLGQMPVLIVALVVFIIIVGLACWYMWHNNQPAAVAPVAEPQTSTDTSQGKPYTDTAKVYTLTYPSDWKLSYTTTQGSEGTAAQSNTDWTKQSRPVMLTAPHATTDSSAVPSVVAVMTKDEVMMLIGKDKGDKMHTIQQLKINGYDAYYDKLVFVGPDGAEKYTDHTYFLLNGDKALFLYFRESYYHKDPPANWSNAQDLPVFQSIVNSVKFL